ncbi:MAG: TonB-dependent receptor, partial [Bacteroidota bacterium]
SALQQSDTLNNTKVRYLLSLREEDADKVVKGTVTTADGVALVGATIRIKNSENGTLTDEKGFFSIVTPDEDKIILKVSYIGYQTQEVQVQTGEEVSIVMQEETAELDDVIVIGYGTDTKKKFNGAVSSVDNKALNNYASANFEQALAGTISGVQVIGNTKNPGDNSVIQIRGINTLTAGTSPLIVVDGNPLTEGSSLSSISTQDIESISILKDAASAAIYGSRASNGVILITTRRGQEGNLKVAYDGYLGVQQRIDKFELTDAYNTALFDFDARNYGYVSGGTGRSITDDNATRDANGGGKRSRIPDYLQAYVDGQPGLTNTNWADEVFRNARQQNHYLNLSGGTASTDYSVSFGFLDQENIIVDSDYKRYTSNFRLNSRINDRFRFGISTNISMADANPTGEAGWSRSELGSGRQADPAFTIVLMQPYYPIYNADGSLAIADQLDDNNQNWDGPISENTIAQAVMSDFTRRNFRVFGNTYLEIEPLKDLTFKTTFGGDFNTGVEEYFGPSTFGNYRTPVANNPAQARRSDSRRENFITENTLNYGKSFAKHSFDALVGFSYQQETRNWTTLESRDFADDNLRNLGGATTITSFVRSSQWALESYFSRVQYAFDDRYSISASLRRDGSSRFGANTKYGDFASVSAGWIISHESFFPETKVISFTKLRGSWGQTGNNQIGDFASIALVSPDNYVVDGGLVSGAYTSSSPNADLSWETNTALNIGLDLGFLDNKLLLTAEYYTSTTSDLLLDVPVPQQSGFSESLQNIGELRNSGLELELRGRGFDLGPLELAFNTNFSTFSNEVLALGDGQDQIISSNGVDFITKVGYPIAQFYNYEVIGVYTSQEQLTGDPVTPLAGTEVGDFIVLDADGDGQITPDDRVMQGDYNPDFTYGIGLNLTFKGFDLAAQFFGVEGRKVSDNMVNRSESGEGFFVPTQYYFDNYFNDRNPDGFFRRPDFSSFSSAGRLTRKSNLSVLDGDYFRLRSLQIGYTLPEAVSEAIGIDRARFYATANNLFNLTKYRGFNADGLDIRSNERQTLTRGYVYSASPLTRFMAVGVSINF